MKNRIEDKYYIFFDGDCGFCNFWVQWILQRDKKDHFLFASLQSGFGQDFLKERGLERKTFNTIYLWKPHRFYERKSKAILRILNILGGKYRLLSYLSIVPTPMGDFLYDEVSKRRKKIGPQNCTIPSPEQRKKIIL